MNTEAIAHPYFLGIGGIGMSALAFHYLQQGCPVAGYDRIVTPLTRSLEEAGAKIHYSERPDLIPDLTDCVIYTPAIPADHAEWKEIRRRSLPVYKRAELLGILSGRYKTFAVAGTHGKTTTSVLLAYLLNGSIGCNAILGGLSPNLGGNYLHHETSPFLVTEADEYDRSFLQLHPYFSAITSWDADHLDIYGTLENMRAAYMQFMRQSEHFIAEAALELSLKPDYFYAAEAFLPEKGMEGKAAYAADIEVCEGMYRFTYRGPKAVIEGLCLSCPGRHNIENAVAAISMALEAGVPAKDIRRLLPLFKGVTRRLECRYRSPGLVYIDDYAHHPAEIAASIGALREFYPGYRLEVYFQPHLYSRTRDLASGFALALQTADRLCLVDIYPAREKPIEGVDTRLIGDKVSGISVTYLAKENLLEDVRKRVAAHRKNTSGGDGLLLVSMGAGDIDTLTASVTHCLEEGGRA